jgi:hypothetical protein
VVDGTGLENRRARKGTGGSNPSLSATQSGLQRNTTRLCREIREICPYFAIIPRQTGLRRTDCSEVEAITAMTFLWKAYVQSGFTESVRRMQCDLKLRIRR